MVDKYVVTGFVKRIGRRDTISKPMSKRKAIAFATDLKLDMKLAVAQYKWVNQIRMKKV